MILEDLEVGDITDVAVRPVGNASLEALQRFEPVSVRLIAEGQVALHQRDVRVVVAPVGRNASSHLATLPRPEARLAALMASDVDAAVLRLWSFGRGHVEDARPVELYVGVAAQHTIADRLGHTVDDEACRTWLADELCLPGSLPAMSHVVARVDSSNGPIGDAFTLVGRRNELDVRRVDGALHVTRVTPKRARPTLTTVLIQAEVRFVTDLTSSDEVAANLAAVIGDNGYLERWSKYNALEHQQFEELAQGIGSTTYSGAEPTGNGAWQFHLTPGNKWLTKVNVDTPLLAREHTNSSDVWNTSTFTGTVEAVDHAGGGLHIRGLESETVPPDAGTLQYALGGSRKSYERRLNAAQRLGSGNVPMPSLALLLELKSPPEAPTRRSRSRRLGWDTPAARAVFGSHEPTPAQKRAIEIALNTPDLAVIQGPPGTGKTKVIAAVAARIAEEHGDSAARRVLLTSHQHDAVDNVASRTTVFGLPTVKEGPRQEGGSWIEGWRQSRLDHAAAQFESIDQGDIAELRRWIYERHQAYFLAPSTTEAAADLLDEVADRCHTYMSARFADELRTTASRIRRSSTGRERDRALLAAIRSVRTTGKAHLDDGPANAARLLQRMRRVDLPAGLHLEPLEIAATTDTMSHEQLKAVADVKDHLLDVYGLVGVRTATPVRNEDVLTMLRLAVQELDRRLLAEGKGVASVLARLVHDLETDSAGVASALGTYAAAIAATCQASAALAARPESTSPEASFDTVIVDEAARANPLDLQIPLCVAEHRVVLVGDQRQLPQIVDRRIAESIAASEVEVQEFEESLFGRLFRFLHSERQAGRVDRVVTLDAQFRMHPLLGKFVSEHFYEPHGEAVYSPLEAGEFDHQLPGYEGRCAAWIEVPRSKGAETRQGTSRMRIAEADRIAEEVHRLMVADPTLTFGVVSFYRAQVQAILEALVPYGVTSYDPTSGELEVLSTTWRYTHDADGQLVERLRIGTVDAFQGKEFDVVLLSPVRTPHGHAKSPTASFGHLLIENRLNVAMSRQRRLLIVVGDKAGLTMGEAVQYLPPLEGFARLAESVDV